MRCISDEIIQKYIDDEITLKETELIESHIRICGKCEARIENQRHLSRSIKKTINLLDKDVIEIPKFEFTSSDNKKSFLSVKRIVYIIAAACILLFILLITQDKKLEDYDEIRFEIGSVTDVDANRPASQYPLVINIIDVNGNISEYLIK